VPTAEPIKLLLVDDVRANLLALEAVLKRDGVELFKVQSGPEALELLLVHDFALALLDVQMTAMDGFELAELMRGTERTRRVPIIFLTAAGADERRTFRGYEAGAVDFLMKPIDPQILRNKVEVFMELARQKQELAGQRDELKETAERLASALGRLQAHSDNSPLAMVEFDPGGRILAWSKGAERVFGWSASETIGKRITDLRWMHEDDTQAFMSPDLLARRELRNVQVHRCYRLDGSVIDCEWYNSALLDGTGELVSVNAQILDITERRRAEATQKLLIGELNHRVKNTLATVQAIATQTLRHTGDPAEFTANFSGRVHSMARAHSLLSNATWAGADLAELIHDQLRLGSTDESRVKAEGPEVQLPPQLALHLALILHELGINARKYGALSRGEGQVSLNWAIEDGMLRLNWAERGGPPVRAPKKRGFGSSLIDQSVKAEGGSAKVTYRAEGIAWEIALTLPSPEVGKQTHKPIHTAVAVNGTTQGAAATNSGAILEGLRFLIVEDEPLVSLVITNVLEDAGAEVAGAAGTVEQAMELIEAARYDCAILDGNLKGRPVDEIAAALTRRNIPFLFVSGYGRAGLPQAFAKAPVLSKPFTVVQLLDAVHAVTPPQGMVIPLRKGS